MSIARWIACSTPFHPVLLLPLPIKTSGTTDSSAFETLQAVLTAKLLKRNAFEVITCSREELRQWTGRDSATLWSVDETLDSSNPAVASGARAYGHKELPKGAEPEWTITHSPRYFGHCCVCLMLSTFPT
ncbi:MAG: hypothetical protein NTX27_01395 [Verrucomicrobia bacterium]|nr:hypothetical protein [Verrucomicrobiota bacterium]